ncbi:ImmA/IrrE family metallo-endopeptidase [Nocardiaceae bacterium NPDC056970]
MVGRWHPWRHLREEHPDIDVRFTDCGEDGFRGRWTTDGIEIDRTSNQRERRHTLAHEIVHMHRGPVPDHPHFAMREEQAVDRITARLLIPLDDLIDALVWNCYRIDDEAAEELWVDLECLETRIQNLTAAERRHIDAELERRSPPGRHHGEEYIATDTSHHCAISIEFEPAAPSGRENPAVLRRRSLDRPQGGTDRRGALLRAAAIEVPIDTDCGGD